MRKSMIQMPTVKEIPQLAVLGNVVPEKYDYYEKVVTPTTPAVTMASFRDERGTGPPARGCRIRRREK